MIQIVYTINAQWEIAECGLILKARLIFVVCFCLAKIIAAEGEFRASRALKDASDVISESSSALQLRYLQTLTQISAEKNSTIIFPLPVEILASFAPQSMHQHHHRDHPPLLPPPPSAPFDGAAIVAATAPLPPTKLTPTVNFSFTSTVPGDGGRDPAGSAAM